MADQNLTIICKNCDQSITYFNQNILKDSAIECPKCKCILDRDGNILTKPVMPQNVQDEIKQLLEKHGQLHTSLELNNFDNYYDFQNYYERHDAIVKELESRNAKHEYREDFLDDYYKFNKQSLVCDEKIDTNEILQYLKSFKIKDPFIYMSNDNSLIINSTKEEFEKTSFLKSVVWKTLHSIARRYWGAFKFLLKENSINESSNNKTLYELNCLRIETTDRMLESAYSSNNDFIKAAANIKGEILKQAQYAKDKNKLKLNEFFLNLTANDKAYIDSNIVASDFIDTDYPLYVTKNLFGLDCEIHKDGDTVTVFSFDGIDIAKYIPNILKSIKELKTDGLIILGTLELIDTQTKADDVLAYLKSDYHDKNIVCNINDVLYSDKDIHDLNFSERKKFINLLGIKQSSFDITQSNYLLNETPYLLCKKRTELERALKRIAMSDNYCGAIIRTDMRYSLAYNQFNLFKYSSSLKKQLINKSCGGQATDETLILCDFLNCEIKDIYINVVRIPAVESGNIFNAIEELAKKFTLVETRNFSSYEMPPIYQEVRLKKNLSKVYLIEGTRFYYDDIKNMPIIMQCYPVWGGYQARFITHVSEREYNAELVKRIALYAHENNFLKNEKFSVAGEFLDEQVITVWDDLKLSSSVKDKLKKLESLVIKNDATTDSRGLIFIGPPGCGKTLTGKLLSKMASTFIWVTAKDFADMGSTYALTTAFNLARDLRPTILFIEDIDSYIEYGMVDLLKTELDGMKLNNGVFTILTSNFPEKLPEALIDRPGRFHDIIYFTLPNEEIRKEMILHFLKEEIEDNTLDIILKQTEGFSGAHIKEICRFAQIIQKEDKLDLTQALLKSLEKLLEQRKLINDLKAKEKNMSGGENIERI